MLLGTASWCRFTPADYSDTEIMNEQNILKAVKKRS